jgi:hypothetical protein
MKIETDLTKKEKSPRKEEVELVSLMCSNLAFGGANRQLRETKIVSE